MRKTDITKNETVVGEHLKFERKDVWDMKWADVSCIVGSLSKSFRASHNSVTRELNIDDGDGNENVTNLRFFKLCRAYSNSLKMSNVGEFPWS